MEKKDNIELRSEKVRHIIGRIPPLLIHFGTTIIALIVLAMAIITYFVHYPITINVNGEIVTFGHNLQAKVFVPYKYAALFNEKQTASVEFEGYDTIFQMNITPHFKKLITIDEKNYFEVKINLSKNDIVDYQIQPKQKVEAEILISDKTIWQLLGF